MFVMTSNFKQIIREEILRQRVAWVTWTLIAVNFISWFMVAWLYDLPLLTVHNSYVLLRAGAINGNLLWAGEQQSSRGLGDARNGREQFTLLPKCWVAFDVLANQLFCALDLLIEISEMFFDTVAH